MEKVEELENKINGLEKDIKKRDTLNDYLIKKSCRIDTIIAVLIAICVLLICLFF